MLIAQVVGIGMIISFLFTETVGLSAGGIIVPGYLAFFWGDPYRLIATLVSALLTYGAVRILSRFVIIFGRRRFMITVLLGYVAGWGLLSAAHLLPVDADIRTIGYVIPGLIANDMIKQGILSSILAISIVSLMVRMVLLVLI